jgi:FixJ family two-component response regulator
MPGLSGLELQQRLIQGPGSPSIVFITAHGDVPMAVRAMKAGALEFLQKPFRDDDLLEAIWNGLRVDAERRAMQQAIDAARQRYELLTAREREVLGQVVAGALNKQIGAALGISEQTVKVHRHHITRKLAAHSVADLMHVHELAHRR